MKNIFGVNLTENRNNEQIDGAALIRRRVSKEQADLLNGVAAAAEGKVDEAAFPFALRAAKIISCIVVLLIVVVTIRSLSEASFGEILQASPLRYVVGVAALFLCAGLQLREEIVKKKAAAEVDNEPKNDRERLILGSKEQLSIPADAAEMDMVLFFYRQKNGEDILITSGGMKVYRNAEEYVFTENGAFCIADAFQRLEIPLTAIGEIREVKEKMILAGWNKEIPYNIGRYKPYKMKINQYGLVTMNSYYSLTVDVDGTAYEMFLPVYELETFLALTGKSVAEVH